MRISFHFGVDDLTNRDAQIMGGLASQKFFEPHIIEDATWELFKSVIDMCSSMVNTTLLFTLSCDGYPDGFCFDQPINRAQVSRQFAKLDASNKLIFIVDTSFEPSSKFQQVTSRPNSPIQPECRYIEMISSFSERNGSMSLFTHKLMKSHLEQSYVGLQKQISADLKSKTYEGVLLNTNKKKLIYQKFLN